MRGGGRRAPAKPAAADATGHFSRPPVRGATGARLPHLLQPSRWLWLARGNGRRPQRRSGIDGAVCAGRARPQTNARRHAGGAGLVVLSPVLAALAAVILIEDGRPVLFSQERAGRDGEPFTIYKFRTMIRDASSQGAGLAVNEGDERILRFGDAYRRLGLDELPQLWNVLRGEMSLIGPRPTLLEQVERYSPRQRLRLKMRPGVTGWSQIHGRTSIPWSRRIELDVVRRALVAAPRRAHPLADARPDDPAVRDVQGLDRRLGPVTRSSVLLTCAGLRVDVVRAFREALDGLGWDGDVVAVDANPLSPALMMADHGVVVPRARAPTMCPRWPSSLPSTGRAVPSRSPTWQRRAPCQPRAPRAGRRDTEPRPIWRSPRRCSTSTCATRRSVTPACRRRHRIPEEAPALPLPSSSAGGATPSRATSTAATRWPRRASSSTTRACR